MGGDNKRSALDKISVGVLVVLCVVLFPLISNAMNESRFFEAVSFGDTRVVHEQLFAGVDVASKDARGGTALYRAISGYNSAVASVLLAHKADPNERCKGGLTPLMIAARQGSEQLVDLLLYYRATVDAELDNTRCTALRYAVERGYGSIVKMLMAAGADCAKRACDGKSPYAIATPAARETMDTHRLDKAKKHERRLKETVFDCCARKEEARADIFGSTPLIDAAALGSQELVAGLLDGHAEVDATDSDGRTPLIHASLRGCAKIAKVLLDAKALIDARDHSHTSALGHAAKWGRTKIVSLLLEHRADMHTKNIKGQTVLYCATTHDRYDIVTLLLENNARVDDEDVMGDTPLACAVSGDRVSLTELLIGHKANVNAKNARGNVPLMWAVRRNKPRMIRILVQAGADPMIPNERGRSPWRVATKDVQGFIEHVRTKKQRALSEDGLLMESLLCGSPQALVELVAGSPASVINDYAETVLFKGSIRRTPVHALDQLDEAYVNEKNNELLSAAKVGDILRVGRAIQDGACVNSVDQDRQAALFWAAHRGDEALVKLLLANEAMVDQADALDFTPLMEAITQKHVGVVTLLLSHKADVLRKNMCGESPVDMVDHHDASGEMRTLLHNAVLEVQKNDQHNEVAKPVLQAEEPESDSNQEDDGWLVTCTAIARDA